MAHTPVSPTTDADVVLDADVRVEELARELRATEDPQRCRDLRDEIVELMLPLADAIAMRYAGRGIESEDLVQVARTALVKAAIRYRPGAGPGFSAFASPTISGEVKRWFRDQGWSVRPPRRIQELRTRLVAEEERLRHDLGRNPRDGELAAGLEVPVRDVVEARGCSAGYHAVSLDAPTPTGSSLADHLLVSPCHTADLDTRDALRRALAGLGERQRLVLFLRFVDELTQREIGERIGVSQMQVSRILRGVLDRLRLELAEHPLAVAEPAA